MRVIKKKEHKKLRKKVGTPQNQAKRMTKKYFDPISKEPLLSFKTKEQKDSFVSIPKDEGDSFAEILKQYDKNTLDLEYLLAWPITSRPWALCDKFLFILGQFRGTYTP